MIVLGTNTFSFCNLLSSEINLMHASNFQKLFIAIFCKMYGNNGNGNINKLLSFLKHDTHKIGSN